MVLEAQWDYDHRMGRAQVAASFPGFAAALLWLRRGRLTSGALEVSWWGAPILAAVLLLSACNSKPDTVTAGPADPDAATVARTLSALQPERADAALLVGDVPGGGKPERKR